MRPRRAAPANQNPVNCLGGLAIGCGLVFASLVLLCAAGMFFGGRTEREARKELAEADRQWEQGQKVEASARYQKVLDRNLSNVPNESERPVIYQRMVDSALERGHPDTARVLVETARNTNLTVRGGSKATEQLFTQVRAERAKYEAEEQARRVAEERARQLAEENRQREDREAQAKRQKDEESRLRQEREAHAKQQQEERKRRTVAWRAALEEKADALAAKGDAAEAKLVEREATYKRRIDAGGLDYSTKQEIERLKKEIPTIWAEVVMIDDALAAGPPESLFVDNKPQPQESPPKSSPPAVTVAPVSPPPTGGTTAPLALTGPKTVHVSGYTKKDGTYVAPHVRSSPRR